MLRRVLGPSLGFRHKEPPATSAAAPAPGARPDQVAEVVCINPDDSVSFRVPPLAEGEAPLTQIEVVYATVAPPNFADVAWFLDPSHAFPKGVAVLALTNGRDVVVPVQGVPYGISFVQVLWGYAE